MGIHPSHGWTPGKADPTSLMGHTDREKGQRGKISQNPECGEGERLGRGSCPSLGGAEMGGVIAPPKHGLKWGTLKQGSQPWGSLKEGSQPWGGHSHRGHSHGGVTAMARGGHSQPWVGGSLSSPSPGGVRSSLKPNVTVSPCSSQGSHTRNSQNIHLVASLLSCQIPLSQDPLHFLLSPGKGGICDLCLHHPPPATGLLHSEGTGWG